MYVFFICQIYYKLTYFLSLLFIVDNDLFWYAKVVKHEYEMMIPSSSSLFLFRLKACRLNGILSFARLFDVDNLYLSLSIPPSLPLSYCPLSHSYSPLPLSYSLHWCIRNECRKEFPVDVTLETFPRLFKGNSKQKDEKKSINEKWYCSKSRRRWNKRLILKRRWCSLALLTDN